MSSALGRVLIAQSVISCFISDQLIFIETLCVPKRETTTSRTDEGEPWLVDQRRQRALMGARLDFNPVTKTAFEGASYHSKA